MQNDLFSLCRPYPVVSLVGLSKSAGKTTVLKHLIHAYKRYTKSNAQALPPLAVTSVGQGGVFPEIRIYKGMYAATAAGVLRDCDFTRRIVHTTGISTPLGEVIVAEALSDGRVSLAGPSVNSQLGELCRYMRAEIGAGQILVDGSGDRRTFAQASGGVILCAGAALNRDINAVAAECAHICRLMNLPLEAECREDAVIRRISGALTDEILGEITDCADIKITAVIAADMSKIFVKSAVLDRFLHRGGKIYVNKPADLIAAALNPTAPGLGYAFDRAEFLAAVRDRVSVPVFDVEEHETVYG